MKRLFIAALAVFLISIPAQAVEFRSRIVEVVDGDSLTAVWSGRRVEVRLWGIDAPEWNQSYGRDATKFVERLVLNKRVRIEVKDRDHYTRFIARIILPNGRDLGVELVKAGLAWWTKKYAPKDKELPRLEKQAKKTRRGLWSQPKPITPWAYRRK